MSALILATSFVSELAQSGPDPFAEVAKEATVEGKVSVPKSLAEAHLELERQLPKEESDKIDAMDSESEMTGYHLDLGMSIRNSWGLRGDSPLAKHMRELGFSHADDMSSVILMTFWCKRHGKDFRLKERAVQYEAYWKENKWPENNIVDPDDRSEVVWIRAYEAEGRPSRTVYIGRSKKTKRLLAFENPTGVYVPDKELLDKLRKKDTNYTMRVTEYGEADPLVESKGEQVVPPNGP